MEKDLILEQVEKYINGEITRSAAIMKSKEIIAGRTSEVLKSIQADLDAEVEQYTMTADAQASYEGILQDLRNNLKSAQKRLNSKLLEIFDIMGVAGVLDEDLRDLIEGLHISPAIASTLARTYISAIGNAINISNALSVGYEYFEYVGSPPEREFCNRVWTGLERDGDHEVHGDRIYHIDEIRKMDNGQGLDAEWFCGGYNCLHTWVAYL